MVTGFDQFQIGVGPRPIITVTDAEGRFRANPGPGAEGIVIVSPPEGQPYLANGKAIDWPKGAVTHSADLALPRGVMMRGKVAEHGSGRPVAGAVVRFFPHRTANDEVFARFEPAGADRGRRIVHAAGAGSTRLSRRRRDPATITCFRSSTGDCSSTVSRAVHACTRTRSLPAIRSRAARART